MTSFVGGAHTTTSDIYWAMVVKQFEERLLQAPDRYSSYQALCNYDPLSTAFIFSFVVHCQAVKF